MSNGNLKLELRAEYDRNNKKYYIAKLKGPFTIDCHDEGVAFIVFVSTENEEELHIVQATNKRGT